MLLGASEEPKATQAHSPYRALASHSQGTTFPLPVLHGEFQANLSYIIKIKRRLGIYSGKVLASVWET